MARNQLEDEFTVHVISSASMQILKSNTLASFRRFFIDEIHFSGNWRVAFSEFIFPTKIENVVEGEFIAFSLKEYEEATKKAAEANISRQCNGPKLGFIPGTFDNVNQLLALFKRTARLPHFSFREIKNSRKYEILFGKHEGITFLSKEIPSILGFDEFLMAMVFILAIKWIRLQLS